MKLLLKLFSIALVLILSLQFLAGVTPRTSAQSLTDWSYSWDWHERLGTATSDTYSVSFDYAADTRRLRKTDSASNDVLYPSKFYEVENTIPRQFIYAGNRKIATITDTGINATIAYHHEDHLTGASVDTDSTGAVLQETDYHPYGSTRTELSATGYANDYQFTGQENDKETGLYYYYARYYDSILGRFISQDPWQGDIQDPQSLNKYSYVKNNPVKYVDPTGETVELVAKQINYNAFTKLHHRVAAYLSTHFFLQITPDNPADFGYMNDEKFQTTYTLGAYDVGGTLEAHNNVKSDKDAPENLIRNTWSITPPKNVSDTELIKSIWNSYDSYGNDRVYNKFGYDKGADNGNSNNFATGLLEGAGVSSDTIYNINPSGFELHPGFGTSLPEMSPNKEKESKPNSE